MKKKLSIAIILAIILMLTFSSLAFAAVPPAYVEFTTDAPCPVSVLVISYVDPNGVLITYVSGSTPWTLDTTPSTPVTFSYTASVVCNGTAYNFISASPAGMVTSGAEGSTTTVTGHYTQAVLGDFTPPVWTVPADFNVEATGSTGAVVTYSASATDPDDAVSSQTCTPASGATFPLGATTVNCTATDTNGNIGTANFTVTVVDTTPPNLSLPADMSVSATSASGAVVSFTASANDLVDGAVPVTCLPASDSNFPMGTTTVNCSASDSHGNSASGSFTVTVGDTTPPVLTLPADITVDATSPSGTVVNFVATANDAIDGSVPVTCSPASGSMFPIGTTTVTCSAADSQGNSASGSFTVTVSDTIPPVLSLPADMVITASNASGAVVNFTASATDAVDGPVPVTCSPASGSTFPLGSTTVTCSASDSQGNMASGSFTVTVQYATVGTKCGGVAGHQILRPIDADGSSVFKQGSVVPAKFRVCGADGKAIGDSGVIVSFRLVGIVSKDTTKNVNQEVLSNTPFSEFRSGAQQWIFNIDTKNLDAGNTYIYLITLNDGSTIQFQFALR